MVTQYTELTLRDRSEEAQYVELTLTDGRPSTHNSPWQMGVMVSQYAKLTLTGGSDGDPVRRTHLDRWEWRWPYTQSSPWQMGVRVTLYAELTLTDGSEGGPVRRTFGRITDEPRVADQLVTMVTDKTTAAAERMRERCTVSAAMERGSWVRTSGNCNNYSSIQINDKHCLSRPTYFSHLSSNIYME